ncbi:MAG TPA: hypothetical protein VMG36_02100 [Thermoplasmata archaeon]|nr:hypothetical protein [Thermoplasmata archaeon]
MFSPAERRCLALIADGPAEAAEARLARAFANPTYRRKLLWGIRQKAGRSIADWQLYAAAADRDPRVLPRPPTGASGRVPVVREPFAAAVDRLRSLFRRGRRPSAAPPDRGRSR